MVIKYKFSLKSWLRPDKTKIGQILPQLLQVSHTFIPLKLTKAFELVQLQIS